MSSASERLQALKQQSSSLYESTLLPPTDSEEHDALPEDEVDETPVSSANPSPEGTHAGWPLCRGGMFDDLKSAQVFYWDPMAEDKILTARGNGQIAVEIQPVRTISQDFLRAVSTSQTRPFPCLRSGKCQS